MFTSSTGHGIMLRLKSLLILVIPTVLGTACENYSVCIAPEAVMDWMNSFFFILFGVIHAYAWFRSLKSNV